MPAIGGGVSVGNLTAFLGLNDSDFTRGIARATNSLSRLNSSMRAVGQTMTTFITLPLIAIGGGAINASMKFQKAFSEIEGIVRLSREQVQGFQKDVLSMAHDTGRAPQELADALSYITQSGFQGSEALDILKVSAMSAAAGMADTQKTADVLTSAISAYGKENMTAAQAADLLTAVVREGKAEPAELATSLGYAIPIAAQMGVSLNEVGAAIAAMTRITKTSTAATQLRQLLSDILDPSVRARAAIAGLGTTLRDFQNAVDKEGLLPALMFLKDQMLVNGDAFTKVFGNVRSLTGALELVGKNLPQVQMIFADLADNTGDLQYAMDVASQTASFKFSQALADLKVAGIQLGNALLPIFLKLVQGLTSLAHWFTSLTASGKQMVVVFAALAAAAGPLLIMLSSMVALFSAISLPVAAVIAAIGALGLSFVYVYENWEAVKERISDWSWWRNALISMVQAAITHNPISPLITLWNALVDAMGPSVLSGIFKVEDPFKDAIQGLELLKVKTNDYKHQFGSFTEAISSFAKKAGAAIVGMFPTGGGGGSLPTPPTAPVQKMGKMATAFNPFAGKLDRIYTDNSPLDPKLRERLLKILNDSERAVRQLNRAIEQMVEGALADLGEALGELFSGQIDAKGFFDGLLATIANFIGMLGKALIAAGVASDAFKHLFANPFAAIAAGVALVALSAVIKGMLSKGIGGGGGSGLSDMGSVKGPGGRPQGLAVGGYVTSGGVFQLHKDELVSLPRGSAVTPAHMANGGMNGRLVVQVEGSISGYNIDINQKKNTYKRSRMG